MKATHLLIITVIVSALFVTEASFLGKLFGNKKRAASTTVAQDLIDAKNTAYQGWINAQHGLSDMSNNAWDTLYDAYEHAWIKYQEARLKVFEASHKSIDKAVEDYEKHKAAVREAQSKLAEYLERYKDKPEDMTSDAFFTGLDAVENAAHEARTKFHEARDTLARYYDEGYEEAVEDYNAAAQYLSDAAERATNYAQYKTHKNYEKTKTKLEQARAKAKDTYATSKSKYRDFKAKVDTFNKEVAEHLKEYLEAAKSRASWAADWLKSLKDDAKFKAAKNYNQALSKVQAIQNRSALAVTEAEEAAKWAANRTAQFATDVFEAIKQKYQNLKDEL